MENDHQEHSNQLFLQGLLDDLQSLQEQVAAIEARHAERLTSLEERFLSYYRERFNCIDKLADYLVGAQVPGDYYEFGVSKGVTFAYSMRVMQRLFCHMRFVALDSFEGLPAPHGIDLIEGYSHGMQQKMALAGALVHDPKVLFLDEPTVGLDPRSARLIKDLLAQLGERGTAVLFSTHILEIAERMCDRVAIIDKGQIVAAGTLDELRNWRGQQSLEDIFLSVTGGAEYAEIAEVLS